MVRYTLLGRASRFCMSRKSFLMSSTEALLVSSSVTCISTSLFLWFHGGYIIIISSITCVSLIQYVDANIGSASKPEDVHLWPLLSVFEFELVGLNNALEKEMIISVD